MEIHQSDNAVRQRSRPAESASAAPAPSPSTPSSSTSTTNQSHLNSRINPSSRRRRWGVFSYPLYMLLGVPFWWLTTSVERRSLSIEEVEGLDVVGALQYKYPIHILDTSSGSQFLQQLERYCETQDCSRYNWQAEPSESGLDVRIGSTSSESAYIDERTGKLELPSGTQPATILTHLSSLLPSTIPSSPSRAIPFSRNITLSFSLLNEDASLGGGVKDWDIEKGFDLHMKPYLTPLSDVYNIRIESNVLYHAPLKVNPTAIKVKEEEGGEVGHWLISREQMKTFVNSEKWTLDSGSTTDSVLKFMLFVPSVLHSPMKLESPDDSPAFLIPQTGGVVIHNDPLLTPSNPALISLPMQDLHIPFLYFSAQLYALLGIPSLPTSLMPPGSTEAGAQIHPMTSWQKQLHLRGIIEQNVKEAQATLISIGRLVKKIKEMRIDGVVRDDVGGAVEALKQIVKQGNGAESQEIFELSRKAVHLANKAFFNPSMMGLLYFPEEHKYAVYTPLFAPVAVPMVVALLKEFKQWRSQRKVAKAT